MKFKDFFQFFSSRMLTVIICGLLVSVSLFGQKSTDGTRISADKSAGMGNEKHTLGFNIDPNKWLLIEENQLLKIYLPSNSTNTYFGNKAGERTRLANPKNKSLGNNNTYLGHLAGSGNNKAINNTYFGFTTGRTRYDYNSNTLLGAGAGANLGEAQNVHVGAGSGAGIKSGSQNTLLGFGAGAFIPFAHNSVYIGNLAGYSSGKTGKNNIFIGDKTGPIGISGNNNIFIGGGVGKDKRGKSNLLLVGSSLKNTLIRGTFDKGKVIILGKRAMKLIHGEEKNTDGFRLTQDTFSNRFYVQDSGGLSFTHHNKLAANGHAQQNLIIDEQGYIYTLIKENKEVKTIDDFDWDGLINEFLQKNNLLNQKETPNTKNIKEALQSLLIKEKNGREYLDNNFLSTVLIGAIQQLQNEINLVKQEIDKLKMQKEMISNRIKSLN